MRCSRPGRARDGPRPRQLLVARVGLEALAARCGTSPAMRGRSRHVRHPPRLGAVGDVAVGEQHHRRHVRRARCGRLRSRRRSSRPGCARRRPAAATRRCGRTSPAAGRLARSWSACRCWGRARWTLTITSGSSSITARPIASALSAMPGPLVVVSASAPRVGRADRRRRPRRSRLRPGTCARPSSCARQLVQDVGGRRDRIASRGTARARSARPRPRSRARALRCPRCCGRGPGAIFAWLHLVAVMRTARRSRRSCSRP